MADVSHLESPVMRADTTAATPVTPRVSIIALGMSLSLSLAISYVLCVLFDLWFPELAMYETWERLLPGFVWLSWSSFLLGLAEVFAYGWYAALLVGAFYSFFAARARRRRGLNAPAGRRTNFS